MKKSTKATGCTKMNQRPEVNWASTIFTMLRLPAVMIKLTSVMVTATS